MFMMTRRNCTLIEAPVTFVLSALLFPAMLGAICSALAPELLAEEPRAKTIVVFDASGSMWGQVKGQPKISIAKEVVSDLVDDWDPQIELGLIAYGHRSKDDCADIESLIPVGKIQKERMSKVVGGINAKGMTPLTESVVRAANELKFSENKATVILVSDGIETCGKDPCKISKELEAKGIDFTAHVIAFDVGKESDRAKLKCIADNTGGKFLLASDAASLRESISEAITEVAKSGANVELVAVFEKGGTPVENVRWEVTSKPQSEISKGKVVRYGGGFQPQYEMEPGEYVARVVSHKGKATAEQAFIVPEEGLTKVEVLFPQEGRVALKAVNTAGGEAVSDVRWEVLAVPKNEMDKPTTVTYGGGITPEYQLLPGRYIAKVTAQKGQATAQQEFEVQPGKVTNQEVLLSEEGQVVLHAVHQAGSDPVEEVRWEVLAAATSDLDKPKVVKYGGGATPRYQLLPGKYIARATSLKGEATAEGEFEVQPGKLLTHEVLMPQEGILKLAGVHAPGGTPVEDLQWQVYSIEEDSLRAPKLVKYGGGNQPEYQLLPGKYSVKVKSAKGMAEAQSEAVVEPGKRLRFEVTLPQEGAVELVAVGSQGGAEIEGVRWELFPVLEDEMKTPKVLRYWSGNGKRQQVLPGKYLAKLTLKDRRVVEQEVTVEPGKLAKQEVVVSDVSAG